MLLSQIMLLLIFMFVPLQPHFPPSFRDPIALPGDPSEGVDPILKNTVLSQSGHV